ncbi:MAG: DUF4342 domain-containing protein [Weeksellaceae bacterium]
MVTTKKTTTTSRKTTSTKAKAAPRPQAEPKTEARTEDFKVSGDHLLGKVKEIIREGNVRRLIIKNKEGKAMIEVPLSVGVVGVLLAPVLAAVGAVAALVTECTITVERNEK